MGFFKDMRDVSKMGKEMSAAAGGWKNPADAMKEAQAKLAGANEMMARANQAAQISMTGLDATATITGIQQVGQINFDPLVEFQVLIMRDGAAPYPATVKQQVPSVQFARVSSATTLPAKVDQNDPTLIWLNVVSPV